MRAYGVLLRLYPFSVRSEYGDEMRAIFARRLRDASGSPALLAVWLEAFFDVLVGAMRAHGDILRQDLRYTARALLRAPGFAVTAVLVAAIGIGAATATFSILDHVLVRPLPFREPERLVKLWQDQSVRGYSRMELSPGNFRDLKRGATSFEGLAAYANISVNLVGEKDPERLDGASVNADLFDVLDVQPALGRGFTAEDDRPGSPGVVVLSHGLWKARFAGSPDALGKSVLLDGAPYSIVGVMPQDFAFPSRETRLWRTLRLGESDFEDRGDTYLYAVGRLKLGVPLERARAEMRVAAAELERRFPKENARTSATVIRLRDEVSAQSRLLLAALVAAAAGVLLIACTNLASLLLARALTRRRELAVRAAMGAGRERLVRQLLTESLVLAACGGVLGVLLAMSAAPLMARLVPNSLPIAQAPPMDLRMLLIAAALTVATGAGFGVAPALKACGDRGGDALRQGPRSGTSRRTERLRSALVVAEVTASVTLLICSGLLLRALWRVQKTDPGFRAEGVLSLRTALPLPQYEKTEVRWRFYASVLAEIRALPGVASAGYVTGLPMVRRGGIWSISRAGEPENGPTDATASLRYVTPGFFATLGIPRRLGRDVSESDTRDAPSVAVVSESLARSQWPGENPIGRRFRFADDDRTVVGVVGDVKVRGLERQSEPQVYIPARQVADGSIIGYVPQVLVVRSNQTAAMMLPAVHRIIERADPQLPISEARPLSSIVDADTAPRRVQARLIGAFAVIAFLLAAVGIHGLLAFTVSQRAREIGVRIALGARRADILGMVLRRGLVLAAAGIGLGAVLAYALGRAMQALLVGVSPGDTVTFLSVTALSLATATIGSLLPALRAVSVDPLSVMRTE